MQGIQAICDTFMTPGLYGTGVSRFRIISGRTSLSSLHDLPPTTSNKVFRMSIAVKSYPFYIYHN
ncbi:hypothetical protein ACTXT7_000535 [Hymenolepis weldensis]